MAGRWLMAALRPRRAARPTWVRPIVSVAVPPGDGPLWALLRTPLAPPLRSVEVDGSNLTLPRLNALARGASIAVSRDAVGRLRRAREVVDRVTKGDGTVYGVNTGFGQMSTVRIGPSKLEELQENILRSHAAGVGPPLAPEVVRRLMALRINTLARGNSGVSLSTFQALVNLFNSGCTPYVPEQGTVGASGDLAPLAHIGLALLGEGRIFDPAVQAFRPARDVLRAHGLAPVQLHAKDGLSLVNGTQFIVGVGSAAMETAIRCAQAAQAIASLSLLGLRGIPAAFDARVAASRPHAGQGVVASVMRQLLPPGSSDPTTDDVQDPYALRCVPQTHGATLEALAGVLRVLEQEMNSSTDNPLVFADEEVDPRTGQPRPHFVSAGNFHGEIPAKALDVLALYTGELGRVSVARTMLLVDSKRNRGLPGFLAQGEPGLNSGLMAWELTAAALDAENRTLSMPASAESASTSAGKEDHVSMGGFAARKAVQVCDNTLKILAVELLAATHALHLRHHQAATAATGTPAGAGGSFRMPPALARLYRTCAAISAPTNRDRFWAEDYEGLLDLLRRGLDREWVTAGADPDDPDSSSSSSRNNNSSDGGSKEGQGGGGGGGGFGGGRGPVSPSMPVLMAVTITASASTGTTKREEGGRRGDGETTETTEATDPEVRDLSSAPGAACLEPVDPRVLTQALKIRPLVRALGQQDGLLLRGGPWSTRAELAAALRAREQASSRSAPPLTCVVDLSQDDFGARANYGRGHDVEAAKTTPSSWTVLLQRLANIPLHRRTEFLEHVCLVGSVNLRDLAARCRGLHPLTSGPAGADALVAAVREVDRRASDVVETVFAATPEGPARRLFFVNGDHNHMTAVVRGFVRARGVKPVVVYLDLHGDSRPLAGGGPHSGTWCTELFEEGALAGSFVVGLHPMSNSAETLATLETHKVVFEPYTWDALKSGRMTAAAAADDIVHQIQTTHPPGTPVIFSICADSVLGMPASAGSDVAGYAASDAFVLASRVCAALDVVAFTVAELKTSLAPSRAARVGEFLAQSLYVYAGNQWARDGRDR